MPKKKVAWTVMVYLAGDNSLTTECMFALTEMKKAKLGKDIRVIAQFDPRDERLPTQRYEINRKGPNSTLFDDIFDQAKFDPKTLEVHFKKESGRANALAEFRQAGRKFRPEALDAANLESSARDQVITDDTDTGSPVTLYNFISLGIEHYPADHYMVVLSGHAGGTQRDYLLKDESSAGSLTFNELKQVFQRIKADRQGELIDIVGMDNCLMNMAEICYELRGLAQVVVGCESYSPASGWPYRQILDRLQTTISGSGPKRQKSVAADAAKGMVEEYVNYYSPYWLSGMSVTQSALDLSKVTKLRRLIDKFAQALEGELIKEHNKKPRRSSAGKTQSFRDALVLAHWSTQSYNGELYADVYDFCDCLLQRVSNGRVANCAREVMKFVKSEFVLKSCYSGAAYQYSHGVSVYFPWAQVASDYGNLDFSRDSRGFGWINFLRTYVLLTRREPRGMDRKSKLSKASSVAALNLRQANDRMTDDRMTDDRMTDDRMTDDRMTDDRMTDDRMTDDRMTDDRMTDDRMTDDRMTDDRMTDDRMTDDRMTDDRMNSDKASGNPIHSMRNPAVVFFPADCIREGRKVIASQEALLLPK
jgi:pentapeptide MXKDX repeat protein